MVLQSPDRQGQPAAARFQGGAHITVDSLEPFVFDRSQSFTIQAWFQTRSQENQVIAARPGAYSLGVKAGKLSAWIMQDEGQFVEAVGAASAADGQWHHTAAVYDRQAQTLTLYLDGKPDGAPQSIAAIGASGSPSPLTLGAFGGGFPFDGTLDEVSIHRAALAPTDFSFSADYRNRAASETRRADRDATRPPPATGANLSALPASAQRRHSMTATSLPRSKPRTTISKRLPPRTALNSVPAITRPHFRIFPPPATPESPSPWPLPPLLNMVRSCLPWSCVQNRLNFDGNRVSAHPADFDEVQLPALAGVGRVDTNHTLVAAEAWVGVHSPFAAVFAREMEAPRSTRRLVAMW